MEHAIADTAFCKALVTEGLERFDILHDAVVALYESQDYDGLNRLMELCYGTKNRGWVRSILASIGPIKHVTSEEIWDKLIAFLRKGNEERKYAGWIDPEEELPEVDPQGVYLERREGVVYTSKPVLVKHDYPEDMQYSVACFRKYDDGVTEWSCGDSVIAWMRIPQQI